MVYLACGLKQRGHDVELFLTHPDGEQFFRRDIDSAGIPVHGVSRGGRTGFSPKVLVAIRRLIAREFDGVVSFQLSANGYAVIARLITWRCRARIVCGERTLGLGLGLKPLLGSVATGLIADAVVANSYTNAAYLRRLPGLATKTSTIWNGYPISALRERSSCAANSTPLRLLVIGRQAAEKNGLCLFRALLVLQHQHGWTPTLCWAGAPQDDPASRRMRQDMDALVRDNPVLATRCSFIGEVKDVHTLYDSSDALVLPSLYEGLPNVMCEAMIAGCPVIASDVCDHALLLGRGERGLLCDPTSPESIADALERFRTMSQEQRAAMAMRARRFAEQHLALPQMVGAYERLLATAMAPKAQRGN
jgi:glycosyltransferase involved in cell wall biosynthesis